MVKGPFLVSAPGPQYPVGGPDGKEWFSSPTDMSINKLTNYLPDVNWPAFAETFSEAC